MDIEEDYQNHFYMNGHTVDISITNNQMEQFLFDNNIQFENLSLEFIKKIQQYNVEK